MPGTASSWPCGPTKPTASKADGFQIAVMDQEATGQVVLPLQCPHSRASTAYARSVVHSPLNQSASIRRASQRKPRRSSSRCTGVIAIVSLRNDPMQAVLLEQPADHDPHGAIAAQSTTDSIDHSQLHPLAWHAEPETLLRRKEPLPVLTRVRNVPRLKAGDPRVTAIADKRRHVLPLKRSHRQALGHDLQQAAIVTRRRRRVGDGPRRIPPPPPLWTAMKEGLPGDTLRRVIEERARGGPFSCCTLDWI